MPQLLIFFDVLPRKHHDDGIKKFPQIKFIRFDDLLYQIPTRCLRGFQKLLGK